ncbi:hypothetical protein [Kordiimonas aquimaris]|uniref:hypothetical protein n=1 Tax=Kordiimonas aquimaris TaxID=707591 RepID=UPI0021D2DF81|nr:hypothetical protein [Kordiimonas aquimaris]
MNTAGYIFGSILSALFASVLFFSSTIAAASETVEIAESCENYLSTAGVGDYRVCYTYTGENWPHADVAAVRINTEKPIAIIPVQYTVGKAQPGASVNGRSIGFIWNTITQEELAKRLRTAGFYVLVPTIQMYGENWDGFQGLEHFIAGVHKGNENVQTILLTADAATANAENPNPGAQMLVTGLHERNSAWERIIQKHVAPFYKQTGLGNIGARVRGGLSDKEGSSKAWHPLIERAAEYGATVAIIEAARAIDIATQAGSIEAGRTWAAPLFDGIVAGMTVYAQHAKQSAP